MSLLKWIKDNVFDPTSQPPPRSTRPPEHDPGWENRQRAKVKKIRKAGKKSR